MPNGVISWYPDLTEILLDELIISALTEVYLWTLS